MNETNKTVEVLITTLNCSDPKALLEKMNIQSDSRIGNQCKVNNIEKFRYHNHEHIVYNFNEKGVGLNRNNLLMRTKADYCLFGDDDLIYEDQYVSHVISYFEKYPDADVIIFNLQEDIQTRFVTKKDFKVNFLNFMRFGAARIAIKTKCIQTNGILFNICFGGGAKYSNGEDTIFLSDCLKAKLNVYAVSHTIARLTDERESSWFQGYHEKYFIDKGLLYYLINRKHYRFLIFQDALRHRKTYKKSINYLYKTMMRGVINAKQRKFE